MDYTRLCLDHTGLRLGSASCVVCLEHTGIVFGQHGAVFALYRICVCTIQGCALTTQGCVRTIQGCVWIMQGCVWTIQVVCLDDTGLCLGYTRLCSDYPGLCLVYTGLCLDYTGLCLDDTGLCAVFGHTHKDLFGPYGGVFGLPRAVFGPHWANYRGRCLEGKGDYLKSSENNVNSTEPCFFSENNMKNRRTMSTSRC